jgi:hypothetical protein
MTCAKTSSKRSAATRKLSGKVSKAGAGTAGSDKQWVGLAMIVDRLLKERNVLSERVSRLETMLDQGTR